MSKKARNRNRQRRNSPLEAHKQHGKQFKPPMLTLPNGGVTFSNWERDLLPDYLLMAAFLADKRPRDVHALHRLLELIDEACKETLKAEAAGAGARTDVESETERAEHVETSKADEEDQAPKSVFTGRLTEFEAFTSGDRKLTLDVLLNHDSYETLVPEAVFHMLGMYPGAPGAWLLDPWRDRGVAVGPEIAERTVGDLLLRAGPQQGDIATRTKILVCNRWGAAGRVHVPAQMAREFNGWPYPKDQDEMNRKVQATYRATFVGMVGINTQDPDATLEWAQRFWQSNWRLYVCRRPEHVPPIAADIESEEKSGEVGRPLIEDRESDTEKWDLAGDDTYHQAWRRRLAEAREAVDEITREFQALADTTDPDLYNPDRYEVLTGIVGRTLRYLDVFIGYPPLWTMEHGAPVLRALVEARIVLRFLDRRDNLDLYAKFKAYGLGKLKLLKLHLEQLIDSQQDAPADLIEYAEYLDALVNQDVMEEFQEIDVGGNFAGVDLRRMAVVAELEQDYKLVFAPASANVHGEWSIIDENVYERCRNPAHRRHRILRRDRDSAIGPMFVNTLFGYADLLVDDYREATEGQRGLTKG